MSMVIPIGGIRKKMLIRQFLDAGATSPETAQTLHDIGVWKGIGLVFDKLERKGIIVCCSDGRYYIDKNKIS